MYQKHGVANADFLRVCGRDCDGTFLPAGSVLVAVQLTDNNPVKKVALDYVKKYEAAHGQGSVSTLGAHAWDSGPLLSNTVPAALKKARPGTPEFRKALRDSLEDTRSVTAAYGVFNMSAQDHLGFDQRSRVMVEIVDGNWQLVKLGSRRAVSCCPAVRASDPPLPTRQGWNRPESRSEWPLD